MKRALIASFMALAMSVSLVQPAWAFDRVTKLRFDPLAGDRMRLTVILSLLAEQSPPDECKNDAPVVVQRRARGRWISVGRGRTNRRGRFALSTGRRAGRYRARAKAFTTQSGFECFDSTSPTITVP